MGTLSTEMLCYSFGDSKGGSVDKLAQSFLRPYEPPGKILMIMAMSEAWRRPGCVFPLITIQATGGFAARSTSQGLEGAFADLRRSMVASNGSATAPS